MQVNAKTGWVTGRAPQETGEYEIILYAGNSKGGSTKKLILSVGETICLTPPMGWNSWYVHSEGVSEKAIREMALAMEEKGLDEYGWT